MGMGLFGKLKIDPAANPAVLDTGTWDENSAWSLVNGVDVSYWKSLEGAMQNDGSPPSHPSITAYPGSVAKRDGGVILLIECPDRQTLFLSLGRSGIAEEIGPPLASKSFSDDLSMEVFKTDAETLERFFKNIDSTKSPKALGNTPRLGLGCRMTSAIWPAVWPAMDEGNFATNAIQNSLRELNVLEVLLKGEPPVENYLFNFGTMQEGHTGATFEGLWTAGVIEALKSQGKPVYGADADHIMVKRTPDGLDRAKRILDSCEYYTFFTLDVSDILDYQALHAPLADGESYLESNIPDSSERSEVSLFHREKRVLGGQAYDPDERALGLLIGKHWRALNATGELYQHVDALKNGAAFDLELSIDENPADVRTCDNLTTEQELIFLILEAERRGIPLTHIAPNFGVEKGVDYRCPDGLSGLEQRMGRLCRIAEEKEIMLDCHSGDDLTEPTRQTIGRASRGRIHFKLSPSFQVMFAEVLHRMYPDRFQFWWDDCLEYVRREADAGSQFAVDCLKELETAPDSSPSPEHGVFHHFNFASLGKRDSEGQFLLREKFYTLPADFYQEYQEVLKNHLLKVATEILNPSE